MGTANRFTLHAVRAKRPENIQQQRAVSDFDVRHVINMNSIWQLPFGRGRKFLSNSPELCECCPGWLATLDDLSLEFRITRRDAVGFRRLANELEPPQLHDQDSRSSSLIPSFDGVSPNLFDDPLAAFQSFRSGRPGERGDRNVFRYPGFVTLDVGLGKTWEMPWSEEHKLQFCTEAFNITNTQRLTGGSALPRVGSVPRTANATFGNLTANSRKPPRIAVCNSLQFLTGALSELKPTGCDFHVAARC